MEKFIVSLVFRKQLPNNSEDIVNSVRVIESDNEQEAFGKVYDLVSEKYENYHLMIKVVFKLE